jgi:uncharacterized OB-fold protein
MPSPLAIDVKSLNAIISECVMSESLPTPIAAVPYVVIEASGDHYLVGSRCGRCGATLLGERMSCAACGMGDSISRIRLADTGRIRTCSVVSRSYPGVPVPFVAAVVQIDGGGVVRGTLSGAIPENPGTEIGRTVRICIEDSGQRDPAGRPLYSHIFRAMKASS